MSVTSHLFTLARAHHVPLRATIELTPRCNLRCVHCCVTHEKPELLTLAALESLFDALVEMGGLYVTLTGGEVACRNDLFSIVAAARRRHFAVTLLSSGTLWVAADWDRLAQLGVDSVRMSVYSVDAAIHDRITGVAGSLAKTLATAWGLAARGVRLTLSCPLMSLNAAGAPLVATLARELGADAVFDPRITWTDNGDPAPAAWRASADLIAAAIADPRLGIASEEHRAAATHRRPDGKPCTAGGIGFYVMSDGQVFPCARWPTSGGSILEKPFAEIWRHAPAFAEARRLTWAALGDCLSCKLVQHCVPCAALSLREQGTLARPSPANCAYAEARAQAAAMMGDATVGDGTDRADGTDHGAGDDGKDSHCPGESTLC